MTLRALHDTGGSFISIEEKITRRQQCLSKPSSDLSVFMPSLPIGLDTSSSGRISLKQIKTKQNGAVATEGLLSSLQIRFRFMRVCEEESLDCRLDIGRERKRSLFYASRVSA